MGLFLGASIITLSEFLEFLMVLVLEKWKKSGKIQTAEKTPVEKF